jgi:CheY-like chemotaxis protein
MMTGHVLGDAKERALAAGAEGFIPKPCLPDELTRQILATLRKAQTSDV